MLAAAVTVATAGGLAMAAAPARAASLCVGGGGCYRTIQAAVDAAHAGDTITVEAGVFAGGVTITKSVRLQGSGAARSVIRGGEHVLTIGAYGAASEPAVWISGVTITGGVARSSPESVPLLGRAGAWAAGGGIEIPPGAHRADGATVVISDSVITGNRANPQAGVPSGIKCPGSFPRGQCPFAPAFGGGIDSWGHLTLIRTAVTRNAVGAAPGQPDTVSDADGGGIFSIQGSLTLDHATVSGNTGTATSPVGRYAEAGGVWAGIPDFGPTANSGHETLVIKDSQISGNTASLNTGLPASYAGKPLGLLANTGGVQIAENTPGAIIENTAITANVARSVTPNGAGDAIDAGMLAGSSLDMSGTVIAGNRTISEAGTSSGVGASGSAIEVDQGGTISNTRITGNYSFEYSPHSAAGVSGALGLFGDSHVLTVRDSVIAGNTAIASSSTGSAQVQGAGVFNGGLLTLAGDTVSGNSGTATGPAGAAQGGGIWNGTAVTGPPVRLTLDHTRVTGNSVRGSHGITVQGGGLYTAPPATVTLIDALITQNVPDQCSGC